MLQMHFQALRPLTTAHLAQTMSLLSLTAGELRQQIDAELAANPALELVDERRCPTCHRLLPGRSACPVCCQPKPQNAEDPIVFVSPREINYGGGETTGEEQSEDRYSAAGEELPVYVFRQVAPDIAPEDRKLAAHLLTNLDEDGLLAITLAEAARYLHVTLSRIENVQRLLQHADPIGVCSCSTREALLVQLEVLGETYPVPALAETMIQQGMSLLSRHQYAELARLLKAPLNKVQEAARFITENLNPYPARSSWGESRQTARDSSPVYYQPDMIITRSGDKGEGPLMVEIIMPLYGTLRVNPLYRQAMQETNREQKDALREDLDRASLFVKCLQQRNHTIQRLMLRIVGLQREFILKGEKFMRPITRAQIALELEVHESTISRAVANKAVQMPNGRIIPLANFFDRSLNVRSVLREIIAQEACPLSDSELADLLAERGFNVARRTVAKYRSMEGILPANLRHRSENGRQALHQTAHQGAL
jgi:RNA polymerase sigma-54 factor